MRNLSTVAELAWRQLNPRPSDEVKNTLEEYIETAKDAYAGIVWTIYQRNQSDSEKYLFESILKTHKYKVDSTGSIPFAKIDVPVIDLPRDVGIYRVLPLGAKCKAMTKTNVAAQDIFDEDPGPHTYYREENTLYFPDGFDCSGVKEVQVTIASVGNIDENVLIPNTYADLVRQRLMEVYGSIKSKEDVTNNQNADV